MNDPESDNVPCVLCDHHGASHDDDMGCEVARCLCRGFHASLPGAVLRKKDVSALVRALIGDRADAQWNSALRRVMFELDLWDVTP